jgi:phenylalanine-4-hydroxylase
MLTQRYESYTPEHFQVWGILYRRQLEFLRGRVYGRYYDDLEQLGFSADEIPRFATMSPRLTEVTGWRLREVEDFLPPDEYLSLTAQRTLPATTFLRTMKDLDHCKRPDMFHDVFGHTALLVNPGYRVYLEALSQLALEHIDDEHWVYQIANFNKWVTEFGLIAEDGEVKAYGAGLLSSSGELDWALGEAPRRLPANVRLMVGSPHQRAEFQAQYFVIDSFDWLATCIDELREVLTAPNSLHARGTGLN